MTFSLLLTIALVVCIGGLLFKAARWFGGGLSTADRKLPAGARIGRALGACLGAPFGRRLAPLLKGVLLDGLFQVRLLHADRTRWLAHILIFWGFIPLLLLHAMDGVVTSALFSGYESTLRPWLWMRNVFGLMVVAGLALAVWRRTQSASRIKTSGMDVALLIVVAAIVLSGFLVEGAKIASQSDFQSMVEEYSDPEASEDVAALEALWVTEYGLAPSEPGMVFSEEQVEAGREINEMSCVFCHDKPQAAFASYALSRVLTPLSRDKAGGGFVSFTYWLHVLLFFGALAWLPFGKLRHAVTSLLSSVVDRCKGEEPDPGLRALSRMLFLDACTHCGLCSDNCSVGISAGMLENDYILPSEKLGALGSDDSRSAGEGARLLEGLTVCTNCLRCTGVCPVGIDLQDLWDAVREDMFEQGGLEPYALSPFGVHRAQAFPEAFARTQQALEEARDKAFADAGETAVHRPGTFGGLLGMTADDGAFRLCFSCKTCTSSCPIVGRAELHDLGLAPHQIIHATALGLDDLVASSRMLWACLGCYRCQESCPQGVRVTDVFYLHKNRSLARMKKANAGKES